MNNFKTINLNLFQPIVYTKETTSQKQDIESVYQQLIKKLDCSTVASECCMNIKYTSSDTITFEVIEAGFADTPNESIVEAVNKGQEIPLPAYDMKIELGKYKFIQLPFLPSEENLFATLMQISCSNNLKQTGNFYLRLLKENSLVILAQFILLLEE
jgi:hypothetical protein